MFYIQKRGKKLQTVGHAKKARDAKSIMRQQDPDGSYYISRKPCNAYGVQS